MAPALRALALGLLLCACSRAIDSFPASAEPGAVLEAYLRALAAGDCDVAHDFVTESFTKGNGELCGVTRVTAYRIDNRPAHPSDDEVVFATQLTTTGSGDGSIPAGQLTWFYSLQRAANGSWRLAGGGSGP